jgi:uncharacterized protein (TIGR03000 family)
MPAVTWGQELRRGTEFRPLDIVRPAPIDHGRLPGPVNYHYIDTSWQNSPYTYYLIHHHWPYPPIPPYPPYPYPYPPYPYPYPYPYPSPYGPGGYTTVPDFYGDSPDESNSYSTKPTTAVLPAVEGNNAVIHVRVPLALAEVTFDGHPTTSTGLNRVYTTPELTPGKTYTYSVTVNYSSGGLPRSETRAVRVQAGQSVSVDFTKPA